MKNKKLLAVLSLIALIGVGLGIALSQQYYDIRSGMGGFKSFCNLSTQMNCDRVAASKFSELIAGFPLSSFTAGWYLALFCLSLIARNRFWERDAVRGIFMMSSIGIVFSVIYFLIMALAIQTYCIFCLGIDAVNILALVIAIMLKPEGTSVHKAEIDKWKKMGGIVATSLIIAVFGLKLFDAVSMASSDIDQVVSGTLESPILPVDVSDTDPSMGPKDAPITIVEFSDFQCPYCRIGAMVMKAVMNRYPKQVRVVFKPFPLDESCNRVVTHPMHLSACEAARVGLCSNKQGKFETVYEQLFDRQTEILPGFASKLASDSGVAADQLAGCTASPELNSELSKTIEQGITLGIDSTPTFFINGHKVVIPYPAPFWDKLIDKLLQQNSAPKAS
jgi:protein-disulfide isomerase